MSTESAWKTDDLVSIARALRASGMDKTIQAQQGDAGGMFALALAIEGSALVHVGNIILETLNKRKAHTDPLPPPDSTGGM